MHGAALHASEAGHVQFDDADNQELLDSDEIYHCDITV